MGEYSIVGSTTQKQHDPLEEALQRLNLAQLDYDRMEIMHLWFDGLCNADEGGRLLEEVRL